jgi:hypothetical protein
MRPLGSPEEIVVPSQDSTRGLMKLKANPLAAVELNGRVVRRAACRCDRIRRVLSRGAGQSIEVWPLGVKMLRTFVGDSRWRE